MTIEPQWAVTLIFNGIALLLLAFKQQRQHKQAKLDAQANANHAQQLINEQFKTQENTIAELRKQVDSLEEKLGIITSERDDLKLQIHDIQRDAEAERRQNATEIGRLTGDLMTVNTRLDGVQRDKADLENRLAVEQANNQQKESQLKESRERQREMERRQAATEGAVGVYERLLGQFFKPIADAVKPMETPAN